MPNELTESDEFLDLSSEAQLLYFHLSTGADGENFNSKLSSCVKKARASADDVEALLQCGFICKSDNGVIVVRSIRLANVLRENKCIVANNTNIVISEDTPNHQADVRQIVAAWNDLQSFGIQPVSRMAAGTTRYKCLVARIKEYSTEDVLKAISYIKTSDFLRGNHGGRPWQVTFDWFVKPNNFPKVLEGNYNPDVEKPQNIIRQADEPVLNLWDN